jgi:hypothetical protein
LNKEKWQFLLLVLQKGLLNSDKNYRKLLLREISRGVAHVRFLCSVCRVAFSKFLEYFVVLEVVLEVFLYYFKKGKVVEIV